MDVGKAWADLQPALAEAAREERDIRSSAWLDLPLDICGVEVVPLTLRRYAVLAAASNPFIVGGTRTAGAIAQFLWIVSKDFCFDTKKKRKFLKRIAGLKAHTVTTEIDHYLDRARFDAARGGGGSATTINTALESSIVHRISGEYGWSADEVLDQPVARLFQLMNIQDKARAGSKAISSAPLQDKLRAEFLQRVNGRAN